MMLWQDEQHKCTSMQQELEMLDKKVNQLMKSFAASCKIKGYVDCNGVIKVVRQHLDKREHCWAIHQNLQVIFGISNLFSLIINHLFY